MQVGVPQETGGDLAGQAHVESLGGMRRGEARAHPSCTAVAHLLDVLQHSKLVRKGDRGEGSPADGWMLPRGMLRSSKGRDVDDGAQVGISERRARPVGD